MAHPASAGQRCRQIRRNDNNFIQHETPGGGGRDEVKTPQGLEEPRNAIYYRMK